MFFLKNHFPKFAYQPCFYRVLLGSFFIFSFLSGCGSSYSGKLPPQAINGVLDLTEWNFHQDGPVGLIGEWEFYWKQLLSPSDIGINQKTKEKQSVYVPSSWTDYQISEQNLPEEGYATYHLKIKITPTQERLSLQMPFFGTAYQAWVNNENSTQSKGTPEQSFTYVQFGNGKVGGSKKESIPKYVPQIISFNNESGIIEVIVQVSNFHYIQGGIWSIIYLGTEIQLKNQSELTITRDLFVAGSLLIMAFYHFGLYLLRRKDLSPLYFGLLCLLFALRILLEGRGIFVQGLNIPWELNYKLVLICSYLLLSFDLMFIRSLFPQESSKRIVRLAQFITGGLIFVVLTTPVMIHAHLIIFFEVIILLESFYVWFILVRAILKKRLGASLFLVLYVIAFAATVNDILYAQLIVFTGHWTPYGIFLLIFGQSYVLSVKFSKAFTHVEELSEDLENKNKSLLQMDQLKDDFLAQTSHELRTPLHGMMGMAESMLEAGELSQVNSLSSQNQQNLALIIASSQRLSHLIDDILDYSRIKHEDLTLHQKPVSVRDMIELIFTFFYPLIKEKPITLINSVPTDLPHAHADEERLQQILYNLLGNATKFTHTGHIEVEAFSEDDQLVIRVGDTGIGIDPKQLFQIFDPFKQVDSTTKVHEGMGLGLAITKHLVELHQGTIEVESKVNEGTCFTFTLPISEERIPKEGLSKPVLPNLLVKTEEDQEGYLSLDSQSSELSFQEDFPESVETPSSSGSSANYHILVVDDDVINLKIVVNHLTPQGYQLTTAINGLDALEVLEDDYPIDLIILDVMMPQMNGYETCHKIRQYYSSNKLPIILLTAKNQMKDLIQGLRVGANDYLTKPFAKEELLARVETHLQLQESYHRLKENNQLRQDIQVRQQKEQELEASHQRLNQILNVMDDAICAFTSEGNFTFFNQPALDFFGIPGEELLTQSVSTLFPDWGFSSVEQQMGSWQNRANCTVRLGQNLKLLACSAGDPTADLSVSDRKTVQLLVDVLLWKIDDQSNKPEEGWILTFTPSHLDKPILLSRRSVKEDHEKRLQQLEIAIESLTSHQQLPRTDAFTIGPPATLNLSQNLNKKLKDPEIRNALFQLITDSVFYWEQTTGKKKVELAEESGIWKVFFEQRGVFRVRTLERHLNVKTFPQKPRWQDILKTAKFVLTYQSDALEQRFSYHTSDLEQQLRTLQNKLGIFPSSVSQNLPST